MSWTSQDGLAHIDQWSGAMHGTHTSSSDGISEPFLDATRWVCSQWWADNVPMSTKRRPKLLHNGCQEREWLQLCEDPQAR